MKLTSQELAELHTGRSTTKAFLMIAVDRGMVRGLALSLLWVGCAAGVVGMMPAISLIAFMSLSGLLGLSSAFAFAHAARLGRVDLLRRLSDTSWLRLMLEGGVLRLTFSFIFSTVVVGLLLFQLALNPALWAWVVGATLVFPVVLAICGPAVSRQFKPAWQVRSAHTASAAITSFVVVAIWLGWTANADAASAPESFAAARLLMPEYVGKSAILELLFLVSGFGGAAIEYGRAIAEAAVAGTAQLLVVASVAGNMALLLTVCWMISGFYLPAQALAQTVAPARELPQVLRPDRRSMTTPLLLVAALFAFLLSQAPKADRWVASLNLASRLKVAVVEFERIEGRMHAPGTIAALHGRNAQMADLLRPAQAMAERQVRRAFSAARAQVNPYLDWHYSWRGDMFQMMSSQLKIEQKVSDLLGHKQLQADWAAVQGDATAVQIKVKADTKTWLAQRQITIPDGAAGRQVGNGVSIEWAPVIASPPGSFTDLHTRLIITAGTGMAAGLGAKLATRAVTARATGSAVGAAVGTAVPVLGTVVGLAVGTIAGFTVDQLLRKRNERINRPAMHDQLVQRINAEEAKKLALVSKMFTPPAVPETTGNGARQERRPR